MVQRKRGLPLALGLAFIVSPALAQTGRPTTGNSQTTKGAATAPAEESSTSSRRSQGGRPEMDDAAKLRMLRGMVSRDTGGGRGGFGRGGPGGGGGLVGMNGLLLMSPDLQEEIKLTAQQKERLQAIADGGRDRIRQMFQNNRPGGNNNNGPGGNPQGPGGNPQGRGGNIGPGGGNNGPGSGNNTRGGRGDNRGPGGLGENSVVPARPQILTVAFRQDPGQGNRGGRGPGGFGGGPGGFGGQGGPGGQGGRGPGGGNFDPAQMQAFMEQIRTQMQTMANQTEAEVNLVLSKPQRKRLKEIELQILGPISILSDPEVQKLLSLTPFQFQKLEVIKQEMAADQQKLNDQRRSMFQRGGQGGGATPTTGAATKGGTTAGAATKGTTTKAAPPAPDTRTDEERQAERDAQRNQIREQFSKMTDDQDKIQDAAVAKIRKILNKKQVDTFTRLLGQPYDIMKIPANLNTQAFGGQGGQSNRGSRGGSSNNP